ncbi:hypothetical protein X275_00315 [Marinitoga sp. 1197]|uniref:polysialyltransferase family glycosyltransferase n=1 Tax=Marinitoga sp. 1197 TaxID=1428449 RepID=UPI000640C858|nr:polysialyltransferase family glycosyltransferase [Marinitoga sp. 1197]KLO24474.1 hypothetical protein X275_00315 [Marinitoga sp. 1197]
MKKILYINYLSEHINYLTKEIIKSFIKKRIQHNVLVFDSIEKKTLPFKKNYLEIATVFDINYFKTKSLRKILTNLSPDLIIMYDDAFLMNSKIITTARKLNIKTLYIQHGIYPSGKIGKTSKYIIKSFKDKFLRYKEYFKFYFNNVSFKELLKNRSLNRILKMFFSTESITPSIISEETHADYGAVFGKFYKNLIVSKKGYDSSKVRIVGNPDNKKINIFYNEKSQNILYLHQPLVEANIIDKNEFIHMAKYMIKFVTNNKKNLLIKPHPSSDIKSLKEIFNTRNIVFIDSLEEISDIDIYVVFSHFSTLMFYFVLKKIPVFSLYLDSLNKFYNMEELNIIRKVIPKDIENLNYKYFDEQYLENLKNQLLYYINYEKNFYEEINKFIINIMNLPV